MNNLIKYGTLAVFVGTAGVAHADVAETKGGITIKTEDGRFEAKVGGRIHFDAYVFDEDEFSAVSGTEFRRARLTLSGKAYGWEYKFENDFAGQSGTEGSGWRDMFVATKVGPGKLTIGQFKPYRSMEELTSSNELTISERPFSSATGIYNGRQFQQGVGYLMSGDQYTFGVSGFSLRSGAASAARNEGLGVATRLTYAPIVSDTNTIHLGASYSVENQNKASSGVGASASYAGRRGPSMSIASAAAGQEATVIGLEAAAVFGPFYTQAEYAMADYAQATGDDQEVVTYYVQAAFNLTGESKPYNKSAGVFRSVKPKNPGGAVELVARYDFIERKDSTLTTVNDGAKDREATTMTVGANWYVNPNLRFMLAYVMGEGIFSTSAGTPPVTTNTFDETKQIALRTQFSF
ncbi:MAG TPA: porin [Solimonas sp.]